MYLLMIMSLEELFKDEHKCSFSIKKQYNYFVTELKCSNIISANIKSLIDDQSIHCLKFCQ